MCQEPTSVKREESSGLNSLIAELQVHRAELEAQNQDLLETQSQLAESRDRFERLYNFAPIGYVTLTSKGKIRDINVTGADMLDQPRSRLINMPFSLFVDTRDTSTYKNHLRHCNSGRAKVVTELRLNTKMGKTIYVQLTSVAVADVYPNQLCFRSAVVDITGLKNAEQELLKARDEMEKRVAERTTELGNVVEALQKNEAFLRVLLEMLPVGIGVYDAHGIPLLENSARKKLCGAADDGGVPSCGSEIRCLANGKVLHPEDWPTTKALEGVHIRESLEVIGPDGTRSFIIASAQPIDVGGDPGALLVLEDITEHRKLEQQLLQSQKMESIGLLAGGIAHDFNNILMGITGYTQMVHERVGDDQLKGALELVMESADRASELTQNLLAFSRKQIINPKPVDLNTIIANISKILTRVIGEDIEYTTNLSEQPLFILGDHTRVEQVLINLAINARDAMPEGGTLIVETATATLDDKLTQELDAAPGMRYASMTVRDSGIGMSRRNKERIFEPFFTTKEIGRGTGLGLSIIYGVVKQHNGTITVESEPGKGTTFTVYLPLVDSKEEAESKPKTTSHEGGNEKLLIVEDDQMVRGLLEKVLALAGYQVVTARDGREAVEVLQSNEEVALIISDVVMPKQNGKEMLNVIRTFNPDIKVIFTSGYPADIISSKGILKEDLVFLQKPVSRNNLLQKVREVLDGRTQKG